MQESAESVTPWLVFPTCAKKIKTVDMIRVQQGEIHTVTKSHSLMR